MKQTLFKKGTALLLVVIMAVSLLPMQVLALDAKDVEGHWSAQAIEKCNTYGIMNGDGNGYFRPNAPITVAEFCTMVNGAFGFTKTEEAKTFTDVPADAWYAKQIAIASAMGYMSGYGDGTTAPQSNITRERAFTILARVYKLAGSDTAMTKFADDDAISSWARNSVAALADAGYISGFQNKVSPTATITRGETAQILWNLFGDIADKDTDGSAYKNLTIRKPGVTVKNATISGDVFITAGVGDGNAALTDVAVVGRTLIAGGGAHTVTLSGSFGVIEIDSEDNTHIDMSKDTTVQKIYINSTASVTQGGVTVSYDENTGKMTFGGAIDKITLNADGTATVTVGGIVYDIVPEKRDNAHKTTFEIAPGAVVKNIVVNAPVEVIGTGKIEKMEVHTTGVMIQSGVDVKPENIVTDKDVPLTIGGKDYVGTGTKSVPVSGGGDSGGNSGGNSGPTVTYYTVTFDAQGGSAVTSQSIASGSKATRPATDPTKAGFAFNGWYDAATGGNVFDFANTAITSSKTIYAQWTLVKCTLSAVVSNPGGIDVNGTTDVVFTVNGVHATDTLSAAAASTDNVQFEVTSTNANITVGTINTSGSTVTVPITGASVGTTTVTLTVTPMDDTKYTSATPVMVTANIVVVAAGAPYLTGVTLSPDGAIGKTYGDVPFTVTVSSGIVRNYDDPADVAIFTVESSDPTVATVNPASPTPMTAGTFTITPVKAGTTTITVKANYTNSSSVAAPEATAVISLTVNTLPAVTATVSNTSVGTLNTTANTLTVPYDTTSVTFNLTGSGLLAGETDLTYTPAISVGANHPVTSISPNASTALTNTAQTITLTLAQNDTEGPLTGNITLAFAQTNGNYAGVPATVTIAVTQQVDPVIATRKMTAAMTELSGKTWADGTQAGTAGTNVVLATAGTFGVLEQGTYKSATATLVISATTATLTIPAANLIDMSSGSLSVALTDTVIGGVDNPVTGTNPLSIPYDASAICNGLRAAKTTLVSATASGTYGDTTFSAIAELNGISSSGTWSNANLSISNTGVPTLSSGTLAVGAAPITSTALTLTKNDVQYVAPASVSFTIAQNNLTITPTTNTKIYGENDPSDLGYNVTLGTPASGDTFTGLLTRASGEDAADYVISLASDLATRYPNYNISLAGGTYNFTINKKALTLGTPSSTTMTLNTTMGTNSFTVPVIGLVGTDTLTAVDLVPINNLISATGAFDSFANGAIKITATYNATAGGSGNEFTIGLGTMTNYACADTKTVTVAIDTATGLSGSPIPVDQSNVLRFNAFANTSSGRVLHYKQIENIILTGLDTDGDATNGNWTPIKNRLSYFTGSYDGNSKTIAGMFINLPGTAGIGMFGAIAESNIQNLEIENCMILGSYAVAGISGYNANSAIQNCNVSGSVTGGYWVGGIAGYSDGATSVVKNCFSTCTVTATNISSSVQSAAGGVVGYNRSAKIENCYATGVITSVKHAGGIAGVNENGAVKNCVAINDSVNATGNDSGRIVGQNTGSATLTANYARLDMTVIYNGGTKTPTEGLNSSDGLGVLYTTLQTQNWWDNASDGVWKDVFGNTDAAPWAWGINKPKFHWQP